ncbi:MAG: hypothetical protein WCO84_01650 [bacterium]
MKERIKVIDSHCGSGKSSYAIQYINTLDNDVKIIYITPFLVETERIKRECPIKDFYLPSAQQGKGSKLVNFVSLIAKGRNIASTHSLFSNITDELMALIREQNYILILDEVMNVVTKFDLYKDENYKTSEAKEILTKIDIQTLIEKKIIIVDEESSKVSWDKNTHLLNKYLQLKELADRELLYYIDGDLLIWTFPIEVFQEGIFDEIYILTYQFDYQMQAYYYKYFGLEYFKYRVQDVGGRVYELLPMDDGSSDLKWRSEIKDLIDVCDSEKLNKVGMSYIDGVGRRQYTSLSKNWYRKASNDSLNILKNNMDNYFSNITKAKTNSKLWTTFKSEKTKFKSKYIPIKAWLECNCRASNDYGERNVLIYAINRYLNPFYSKFFCSKNIQIDEDMYALSEMIQWIFRSAIRNGKPIKIYIPSQRMRELLVAWLKGEI